MTEHEKEIWLSIFMGRLLQIADKTMSGAATDAWAAIEECRRAGVTTGPVDER